MYNINTYYNLTHLNYLHSLEDHHILMCLLYIDYYHTETGHHHMCVYLEFKYSLTLDDVVCKLILHALLET